MSTVSSPTYALLGAALRWASSIGNSELLCVLRAQLPLPRLVRLIAEARAEELDERARRLWMGAEHVVLVRGGEGRSDDPAIAAVGPEDDHLVDVESGADDQGVERVGLVEPGRHLLHDRQPERLEHRQQLAQRDLAAGRGHGHPRQRPRARLGVLGALVLQPDGEFLARGHALEQVGVAVL